MKTKSTWRSATEVPEETPINNAADNMVQDTEAAPETYIAQVNEEKEKEYNFDVPTDVDDPQNDNGNILNKEDATSNMTTLLFMKTSMLLIMRMQKHWQTT